MVKEPSLQPLSCEIILPHTANKQDDASLTHTETPAYPHYTGSRDGEEKRIRCRVREVEYAAFTPLVFSTSGGLEKETAIAYKHLAGFLAEKRKTQYGTILAWMRCTVSFALIRSAVMARRGSRSHVVDSIGHSIMFSWQIGVLY